MSSRPARRPQSGIATHSRSFLSRFRCVCVCEVLIVILVGLAESASWKYASGEEEGDKEWTGLCESGIRQSPVDLSKTSALVSTRIEPIAFIHYSRFVTTNITNNGHTVVLKLDQGQKEVGLAAGGLHGYYILDSIHFHWGGSEHTFNGQRLGMEVHLVHYSADYASLGEAKDNPRGLAVIAVIIHETPDDNPILEPLVESIGDAIDDPGESMGLAAPFSPHSLLPTNRSLFFRYSGSLTTPPCSESVEWTVLYRTVAASRRQLDKFKTLNSEEGSDIEYNYRRTQPHHDRKILFVQSSQYQSIYEDKSAGARSTGCCTLSVCYWLLICFWMLICTD